MTKSRRGSATAPEQQPFNAPRLSDPFFRALVEQTSELVSVLHAGAVFLYANPSHRALLGYDPEELVGRTAFDFIHPDDVRAIKARFELATSREAPTSSGEYRFRHADGTWRVLDAVGTNLLHDPSVNGVVVNARDVTEYKRTLELLAQQRLVVGAQLAELEQLYRTAPVGLALLDCDLRFVRLNDRLATINGRPVSDHLGRTLREVLPDLAATLEPLYRRVIETGEPVLDLEIHGPSPAHPGVEHDWAVNYYRVDDDAGRAIGVSAVVVEITDRKNVERALERARIELETRVRERTADLERANEALRAQIAEREQAEESLRRSEGRYRHLVENITEVIFALDRSGRFTYISPTIERLSGYTPGELIGRSCLDVLHPDDVPELVANYWRTLAGAPIPSEYRIVPKDGGVRWVRSHSQAITANGRVIGSQGVLTDITEERLAEMHANRRRDELAHAQRLTTAGEMTAEIAHQINQPLAAIVNFASGLAARLRGGDLDSEKMSEVATRISSEAHRAGAVIRQLRAFLRKGESLPQDCNVNQLVEHVFRLIEEDFRRELVEVHLKLAAELPSLRLDAILIEQVVLNLLRNALEAMADPAFGPHRLEVETRVVGPDVCVTVADSGAGLPPDSEDQVFEPFFTTKPEGLGLGLSISRSIIEATGGRLWVTRNPDRGTTVGFSLPVR